MAQADVQVFAANLRYLMRKKDIEYQQLADELLMERPRIKAWLGGSCFPTENALVKICEYFGYYDIFKLLTEKITI